MAQQFEITFHFSSTKADGDSYTRTRTINNQSLPGNALIRIVGFQEFGERFTENCFDWSVRAL